MAGAVAFVVLGLSAGGRAAEPQTRKPLRPATHPESAAAQDRLPALLAAQQVALATGDPARIAAATRPLAADLLRDEGKLRILEHRNAQALPLYRRALTIEDDPQTRLELATVLSRTGHAKEALEETQAVLSAAPSDLAALRVQGGAFRALGDNQAAAESFRRALFIRPDVNVEYALGGTLLALHDKGAAEVAFARVLAASNGAAIWHVAIGDAYRQALYYDAAVAEFKKAIAINPRASHAEFFLGYTYLQMNQWGPSSESFKHLRIAVEQAPHEYVSNFYLGALESTDGSDLASSNRHLHAAADAEPDRPEVWLYLGLNAVRQKDTAAAKLYLRKAVALTGSDEAQNNYQIRRVYAVLGRLLIAEGNHAEGDALLAKYKRTEQLSLGNSSTVIADAAAKGMRDSPLRTLPSPAVFPGARDAASAAEDAPGGAESADAAKPTAEQAATEAKLSELLANTFNDLGTAEARLGKYDAALGDFQEAGQWGTPTQTLLHNTGVAAFRVGNFAESARALDLFLADQTAEERGSAADSRSRMMLAMSRFSMGQFAKAEEAFDAIPQVALQDPRAAYAWAFSLARTGKQQEANQIADGLVQQTLPADELSLVCHLYVDTENYAQSIPCYQKAYQEYPDLKLAHYQAAESMVHLDRPADAIAELKQELALSPDNPEVQYAMAYALLQSSRKDEAVALLKKIAVEHPDQADAQYQLGKIELEQGDASGAVEHLEAAEKGDASQAYVHYQLQAAYRKVGRTADADREAKIYKDMKAAKREVPAERK